MGGVDDRAGTARDENGLDRIEEARTAFVEGPNRLAQVEDAVARGIVRLPAAIHRRPPERGRMRNSVEEKSPTVKLQIACPDRRSARISAAIFRTRSHQTVSDAGQVAAQRGVRRVREVLSGFMRGHAGRSEPNVNPLRDASARAAGSIFPGRAGGPVRNASSRGSLGTARSPSRFQRRTSSTARRASTLLLAPRQAEPRRHAYLNAENAWRRGPEGDRRSGAAHKEMLGHIRRRISPCPTVWRRWYYTRTEEGKRYPISAAGRIHSSRRSRSCSISASSGGSCLHRDQDLPHQRRREPSRTRSTTGFRQYAAGQGSRGKVLPDRTKDRIGRVGLRRRDALLHGRGRRQATTGSTGTGSARPPTI
jgi:hypothetical protein